MGERKRKGESGGKGGREWEKERGRERGGGREER